MFIFNSISVSKCFLLDKFSITLPKEVSKIDNITYHMRTKRNEALRLTKQPSRKPYMIDALSIPSEVTALFKSNWGIYISLLLREFLQS